MKVPTNLRIGDIREAISIAGILEGMPIIESDSFYLDRRGSSRFESRDSEIFTYRHHRPDSDHRMQGGYYDSRESRSDWDRGGSRQESRDRWDERSSRRIDDDLSLTGARRTGSENQF